MDAAVGLVRAYLELCGYFVLTELPVREPAGVGYRDITDLDVLAVRFPHRPEPHPTRAQHLLEVFLAADPSLQTFEHGVDVIVGEVKSGGARLNPGLQRAETVEFALRRVGCCPEDRVSEEARRIVRDGHRDLSMAGGLSCRVRIVAFAGHGNSREPGVQTVRLADALAFIRERLAGAGKVLADTQLKDAVLALLQLEGKLATGDHPSTA